MRKTLFIIFFCLVLVAGFIIYGGQECSPNIVIGGQTYCLGQDPNLHNAFGVLEFVVEKNASGTYILDFGTSSVIANNQPIFDDGIILRGTIGSVSSTYNELQYDTGPAGGWVFPYLLPVPQLPTSSGTYAWEVDLVTSTNTWTATGTITK